MLNNIKCYDIHIFGAKVGIFFHITKFICFFLYFFLFACIIQKIVVTLHAQLVIVNGK